MSGGQRLHIQRLASSRTRSLGGPSGGGRLDIRRRTSRTGCRSLAPEGERSSIFHIYHAAIDDPILEIIGYLQVGIRLVEISPPDHVLMDKKKKWEWGAIIFDVKCDGLAMELFQSWIPTVTIVEYKDILLGLVAINGNPKGKNTETHCWLEANEKTQFSNARRWFAHIINPFRDSCSGDSLTLSGTHPNRLSNVH